jgi:DNA-binding response OmpR family regulator
MNVLVADDDGITRLLLSSALSKLGHNVQEAENGRDALALWEREHQRLVISDWMIPDIDGLDFCREIRAKRGSNLTYVILLTTRAGKANYLQAMEAGVGDFIPKPFGKNQLAARVRAAEHILQLHEDLQASNSDLEQRASERTAELQNALPEKDESLSRAGPELRTPMNHMLGFAQLLRMDELSPKQRAGAEQVLTSGRHLLRLIDRVLAVSKSRPNHLSFLGAPARQVDRDDRTIAAEGAAEPAPFLNQLC